MDKQRARQIVQSHTLIPVSYNGKTVCINRVDEQNGVARVLPLDNLNNEFSVDLTELHEDP